MGKSSFLTMEHADCDQGALAEPGAALELLMD